MDVRFFAAVGGVSPNSIRSRILKACHVRHHGAGRHVSPNSIRSRILKDFEGMAARTNLTRFTQFDPFEDTERRQPAARNPALAHVSPNSIRSRILKVEVFVPRQPAHRSFTQFDPFEDTESSVGANNRKLRAEFHPIRSVRGY